MHNTTLFALSVIFSVSAVAQTSKKPTIASSSASSKPLLVSAKEKAEAELSAIKKTLTAEVNNTANYQPCKVTQLKIQKENAQWFVNHYTQFQALSDKIDETLARVNEKLVSIQNASVMVNPVKNQELQSGQSEVKVELRDIIKYFQMFNGKVKSCSKDQRGILSRQMEDPDLTGINVAHSQIEVAAQILTTNLNSSLKDSDATYEISLSPSQCGYKLELKVKMEFAGSVQEYQFSLLDSQADSKITLGDEAKWGALAKNQMDQLPVDGLARYRVLTTRYKDTCKLPIRVPRGASGVPYLTYAEIEARAKAEAAKSNTAYSVEMDFVSIPFTNPFEMQTTEVTQAQWVEWMKSNPSYFTNKETCPKTWDEKRKMCPNHPVERVNQQDIQSFIDKLNAQDDGYLYRLPTQDEWVFAAKAGTTTRFYSGEATADLERVAWFDRNSDGVTHEVATAGAGMDLDDDSSNAYGLYDMLGNVREWTSTVYKDYSHYSYCLGHSYRDDDGYKFYENINRTNDDRFSSIGFRLVRTLKK